MDVLIPGILGIYLIFGLVFAVAFVTAGCKRIDPDALASGIGFRLLIFPASTVLWPLLLNKWIKAGKLPEEHS